MGRFLLNLPLIFLFVWVLMGGERVVASDFFLSLSSQSRHVVSPLVLQSEEIQEFVIFSVAKTVPVTRLEPIPAPVVADVYFDERRLFIDAGLKSLFLQTVEWLATEPQWRLRIEGHCDPRGPSAYNFARADFHLANLIDYLSQLGIPSHQISTLNYGQDPVRCRLTSEQCQEDNLRAENIFPILSIGNTQRGCLARVRLMSGGNWSRVYQVSQSFPLLQRIQVASPSSSF
jgi:hypothetical protein